MHTQSPPHSCHDCAPQHLPLSPLLSRGRTHTDVGHLRISPLFLSMLGALPDGHPAPTAQGAWQRCTPSFLPLPLRSWAGRCTHLQGKKGLNQTCLDFAPNAKLCPFPQPRFDFQMPCDVSHSWAAGSVRPNACLLRLGAGSGGVERRLQWR